MNENFNIKLSEIERRKRNCSCSMECLHLISLYCFLLVPLPYLHSIPLPLHFPLAQTLVNTSPPPLPPPNKEGEKWPPGRIGNSTDISAPTPSLTPLNLTVLGSCSPYPTGSRWQGRCKLCQGGRWGGRVGRRCTWARDRCRHGSDVQVTAHGWHQRWLRYTWPSDVSF